MGLTVNAVSRLFRDAVLPPGAGPDYVNGGRAIADDVARELLECCTTSRPGSAARACSAGACARWTLICWRRAHGVAGCRDLRPLALPADGTKSQRGPGQLILPHPRLQDRAFVLVPLGDVAPQWRHPVSGQCGRDVRRVVAGSSARCGALINADLRRCLVGFARAISNGLQRLRDQNWSFMARVTVEDCVDKVPNRFELVMLARIVPARWPPVPR